MSRKPRDLDEDEQYVKETQMDDLEVTADEFDDLDEDDILDEEDFIDDLHGSTVDGEWEGDEYIGCTDFNDEEDDFV